MIELWKTGGRMEKEEYSGRFENWFLCRWYHTYDIIYYFELECFGFCKMEGNSIRFL